jgi:hypothetical protein
MTRRVCVLWIAADLAREAAREETQPQQEITETEVYNTLAVICEPTSYALAV